VLIIPVGGLVPIAGFWLLVGRVRTVTPQEAKGMLGGADPNAALVDIRPVAEYAASHLDGAENWPFDEIMSLASRDDMPERFRDRKLLLLCNAGIRAGFAARRLQALSVPGVANISGGMQAWTASADESRALPFRTLRNAAGQQSGLPSREMTTFEQWAAVIAGFVIKPLYMLLSLVLIVFLWRAASTHLVALRWGMIFFLAGEAACALNYLVYGEQSQLFEYFHSYGMVVCFGFTVFAALEALDERLIRYSDPNQRCAAVSLCQGCEKYSDVPCGLKRLFLLGIPALLIVALMPFCASPIPVSYNVTILGSFYNYTHAGVHQLFESRYCPVIALVLLGASLWALACKKDNPVVVSKVLFAAGMGPLAFSLFRTALLTAYRDNMVWFVFWEEATELLFVAVAGGILWIFRRPGRWKVQPQSCAEGNDP